jgi:hypothetical protein
MASVRCEGSPLVIRTSELLNHLNLNAANLGNELPSELTATEVLGNL